MGVVGKGGPLFLKKTVLDVINVYSLTGESKQLAIQF